VCLTGSNISVMLISGIIMFMHFIRIDKGHFFM